MSDLSALLPHYEYWDELVRQWMSGRFPTAIHLPEPWWGWTATDDLHSVCLNLSPGRGGNLQTHRCISCAMSCMESDSYYTAMFDGSLRSHLDYGEHWHHSRRYKPLMMALDVQEECIFPDTRHHLSVELSPFHDEDNNKLFRKQHTEDIILHSLKFAADSSRHIVSPLSRKIKSPLRNRVIVRSSINNIRRIAKDHIIEEESLNIIIPDKKEKKYEKGIKVTPFRLKDPDYKNVSFICMSGAHNHLPTYEAIKQIIHTIIKY